METLNKGNCPLDTGGTAEQCYHATCLMNNACMHHLGEVIKLRKQMSGTSDIINRNSNDPLTHNSQN